MLRWTSVWIVLALIVATSSSSAEAADEPGAAPKASPAKAGTSTDRKKPVAGDEALAKRYFSLGQELYRRANYQGALEQFQAAYKALPKADLLYNIARCLEATGKLDGAVDHYKRYLASLPETHSERKLVQARIANIEAQLSKRKAAEKARLDALKRERQARERAERLAQEARAREAENRKEGNGLAIAGWATAGLGVAGVVAGVVLGSMAASKASELEDANKSGRLFSDVRGDIDTGENLETASLITLIAGGTTAIVGGVLLFLHYTSGKTKERREASLLPTVLPSVSPQGASLTAAFRF